MNTNEEKTGKRGSAIDRVFKIAKHNKTMLNAAVFSSVLGYACNILPFVSVFFIAREFLMPSYGNTTIETVVLWIIVAGIAILIGMVFSFFGSYGCHYVAFKQLNSFKLKVMDHLGNLSLHYFNKKTTGGIQKTIDESADRIENFIGHMLPDLFGSIFTVLLLLIGICVLSPWLALTVLITVIVAVAMQMSVFGKKSQKIWADVFSADRKMTGAFSEYVKGMTEVKLFGITGRMTNALETNIQDYKNFEMSGYKASAVPMGLYKSIILSMLTFILPVGVLLISLNPTENTLLAVLMALIITPAIYDPLMTCLSYGTQMATLSVGLDAVEEIFAQEPIKAVDNTDRVLNADIEFKNVSFSYQPQDESRTYAVKNINFIAKQGEMTALVGESGGGKSTIGQLISRFYDIEDNEGEILVGGVNIKEIPYGVLMDSIAYVLQDTYIFSGSIYENITMNRKYSKEAVESAAKAAQCHDFILNTQNGYNTMLGGGGVRLSGGEAQRLSIARAILKDAPIIVLDEALAYSDAENENLIQEALISLTKNKTVIIIAHRLQSVMRVEQILLLKKGEIKEAGTHKQLMSTDTEYSMLWNLQHEANSFNLFSGEKGDMMI